MSQPAAEKKSNVSEEQVKRTIANLVAPVAKPMRSPVFGSSVIPLQCPPRTVFQNFVEFRMSWLF